MESMGCVMGGRVKGLAQIEFFGSLFLIACGAIAMTTEPQHSDDKSGMLLLVLGMCWLGLNKAGEWWGADRPAEESSAAEMPARPTPPRPQPRAIQNSTYSRGEPTITRYRID